MTVWRTRCSRAWSFLVRALTKETDREKKRSWKVDLKGCDVHRFMVSLWSSVGYVGLGAALVVFGPTILDLANELDVNLSVLAAMFACRALGSAFGSISAGITIDRVPNWSYLFMSVIFLFAIASTAVIPVSVNVYMLAFIMFLNGIFIGALDSGTHAVLIRLWKDNTGPCMQILHFAFAFGAFVAPLIAKQFISQDDGSESGSGSGANMTSSSGSGGGYASTPEGQTSNKDTRFRIAYWISAAIFIPTLLAYTYYAVKCDILGYFRRRRLGAMPVSTGNHTTDESDGDGSDAEGMGGGGGKENGWSNADADTMEHAVKEVASKEEDEEGAPHSKKNKNKKRLLKNVTRQDVFRFGIVLLLGVFMLIYVGLEAAYGSLIFTVVVTGPLAFSKPMGTVIQSLFWGTFAFTRLLSVLLALLRIKPSVMIAGNLSGSLVATIIMVSAPHNATAIWLATAVLGMSYASIFPSAMTWMSETIVASGIATSILVTGGSLGDISIPAAMDVLITKVAPDTLFYLTFVGVVFSASLFALLFFLAHLYKRQEARHNVVGNAAQQSRELPAAGAAQEEDTFRLIGEGGTDEDDGDDTQL